MVEGRLIRTCKRLLAAALLMIGTATPVLAENNPRDLALYVRARAADADGNAGLAVDGYAAALTAAPDNAVIALRAYRAAIMAGDFVLMTRARKILERVNMAPADASLLALAEAIRAADKAAISAAIDRVKAGPLDFLAAPFAAWAALDNPQAALSALGAPDGNTIERRYSQEARALLLIATGDSAKGIDLVRVLLGNERASPDLRIIAAEFLAGAGQGDSARSLLVGNDPAVIAARLTLGNGRRATPAIGASFALSRLAADLDDGQSARLLVVIAQAALRLDPMNDRARLLLADALAGDDNRVGALAVLADITPASPYHERAKVQRIVVLQRAGETDAALNAAAEIANAPAATAGDIRRYANLLMQAEQFPAAADAFQRAINRDVAGADWVLYLQLGSALDRAGRWRQAKPVLEKAVALAPDQPVALNYLGYALLEHGGKPIAARKLLEQANILRPKDFAILDSLAWAYFLQGDTSRALPLLETAAKGEPANGTISDHLGDAYWRVGRKYEARYAWQAAVLVADDEDARRINGKIANGLADR